MNEKKTGILAGTGAGLVLLLGGGAWSSDVRTTRELSTPVPIAHNTSLNGCAYRSNSSSGYRVKAACRPGEYVVSGSCWLPFSHWGAAAGGDAMLVGSYPFENGSYTNGPDDGESHASVDGTNGWVCEADVTPDYADSDIVAEVLCCM